MNSPPFALFVLDNDIDNEVCATLPLLLQRFGLMRLRGHPCSPALHRGPTNIAYGVTPEVQIAYGCNSPKTRFTTPSPCYLLHVRIAAMATSPLEID
jgi:hypothetical protein